MMVPFQLSTLPSRRGKTAAERRAKSSAYPLQMPLFSGERVLPPCRRMALSPPFLASTGSLLCWRGSRYGCVARISTNRWRSGSRGLSPANGRCPASGSLRQGWTSNIMTQRGRASATVQVVSDLPMPCQRGGRLCSTRRVGSGRATLRGRQRPLLARWIPAESASRGQQWTPAAGGDRAQIIVRRDDILQLSRCTFARAARTG
ncbi:Uncharacterised protein [Klebsiella pneumoniae]|nr:Uncharacterised protein [Klebsiella pneumoniae]